MKARMFTAIAALSLIISLSGCYAQQYDNGTHPYGQSSYASYEYGNNVQYRTESFGTTLGKFIFAGAVNGLVRGAAVGLYRLEARLFNNYYPIYGYSYNGSSNFCYYANERYYPLYYNEGYLYSEPPRQYVGQHPYYVIEQQVPAQVQTQRTINVISQGLGGW